MWELEDDLHSEELSIKTSNIKWAKKVSSDVVFTVRGWGRDMGRPGLAMCVTMAEAAIQPQQSYRLMMCENETKSFLSGPRIKGKMF